MAFLSGLDNNDPVPVQNTFVTTKVAPTTTTSTTTSLSGSGSSGSLAASKTVQRDRVAFQKATGLRDIAQALQESKDIFARGVRDLDLGRAGGTLSHKNALRKIEDQRITARTNLEQGLRDLQLQREGTLDDQVRGLRNIDEFEEEETERVIDDAASRGIFRSGIRIENEEEVQEDAAEDRFDLNTQVDNLLQGIVNNEGNLQQNVKNILASLDKDESAENSQFKLLLTSFSNLLDDLDEQKRIGIREAGEAKEDLLREVELALAGIAAQTSGGGGNASAFDAFLAFLSGIQETTDREGVSSLEQFTEGGTAPGTAGVPISKLQEFA